ncbi:MAG: hypothetical protein IIZ67_02975 [Bacilli bacterium]|nr:hypothetical protein [Bacilli bacterium]
MDYEKYLETIDVSDVTDSDYVSGYFGIVLEYMKEHRIGIKENRLNCEVKSILGRDVSDVLRIYDKELELNSIYNVYFNRCLNILDDDNYIDVYRLGKTTFYSYVLNISYYNGRIQSNNLSRKNIFYRSKYNEDYKEFGEFHKDRLHRIKVKRRW